MKLSYNRIQIDSDDLWCTGIFAILQDEVGRYVITHKDRLLRLGADLVFAICEDKQAEVVILNQGEDSSFEEDLAKDVLEIITVFSARLYGSRSRKNQKLIDGMKQVGVDLSKFGGTELYSRC